jgi:hypothetical protein
MSSTLAAIQQLQPSVLPLRILVASATANSGGNVVRQLSADDSVSIHAMVRSKEDDRAKALGDLPKVTLVEADFDDWKSIAAALEGVDRAMLVSSAFDHLQFERAPASSPRGSAEAARAGTSGWCDRQRCEGIGGRGGDGSPLRSLFCMAFPPAPARRVVVPVRVLHMSRPACTCRRDQLHQASR